MDRYGVKNFTLEKFLDGIDEYESKIVLRFLLIDLLTDSISILLSVPSLQEVSLLPSESGLHYMIQ